MPSLHLRRGAGIVLPLAVFALVTSSATALYAMSVKEAVELTVRKNPNVGASQAERNAVFFELQQSKGRFFPEASVEADAGHQNLWHTVDQGAPGQGLWTRRRQVAITASQVLFDGFERHYDIYKNSARLDAAAIRVMERSESLGLDAVEAFIDIRRYRNLAVLTANNVGRHIEIQKIVKTQFEGGKVAASDLSQIGSRLATAESVVEVNRQQSETTAARFRHVVGAEPRGLQPVGLPPGMPRSRAEAVALGSAKNPTILAALAEAEAKRHEADQATSSFFPTVSLEGSATYGNDTNAKTQWTEDVTGTLVVRWKLFDGLIRHNRRRELVERATQARLEADSGRLQNTELVERAWAAFDIGRDRIAALVRQVAATGEVVSLFIKEYEGTKRTLLEVLDAETLYFNARFQLIGARAVQRFAAYQLMAGTGQLLISLGIEPPEEASTRRELLAKGKIDGFETMFEPLR